MFGRKKIRSLEERIAALEDQLRKQPINLDVGINIEAGKAKKILARAVNRMISDQFSRTGMPKL
ncbi:MAG: hypothetical protein N2376_03170 [Clostridia bacterium]|nr:hypothetical protein [Clostridia bacterium]